ncbi:Squalene--hopene cyclase [Rubripirellula amarantea]|uniref:Squalene--hopene cyclase n=1 Tax=Rubripirellula amarantea TaxID=2527999 RepID=A0A5C5WK81_9BACT|nr:prenyltransferase/squalene oxidase repeat-containing protein [Rubripirellula amarantea]TWT51224.1 Squalene--hopene cyclase [Rubripirellula amarantea]
MNSSLITRARTALDTIRQVLLDERVEGGHWEGRLSSSALSTATAVSAMSAVICSGKQFDDDLLSLVARGISHLREAQNDDGGYGDTDRSHSNIATSYLVLAASSLSKQAIGEGLSESSLTKLQSYIDASGGIDGLRRRYGKDKTFVVPILSNLAIAGLVPWKDVPSLPFEAAAFPQSMYRWLQMPVVSYAVPALVAIGQAKHVHHPTWFLPWRWLRAGLVERTLEVLGRMQPESGGYLEATPLTAFVVMSLASSGRADHRVCDHGLRFLKDSMREDGSWPIDTNLATWVTSLSIAALRSDPLDDGHWFSDEMLQWMLSCQHQVRHPFTGAEPGGWGWTDLTGAVPDGDDTPAAILAIESVKTLASTSLNEDMRTAVEKGVAWLRGLQNRDGGMPTFCRGWGKLPFDRSSTDLTAHAMRAIATAPMSSEDASVVARGRQFLIRSQQADGSWLPLWFGNQDREHEDNPIYGTAKVLLASTSENLREWQSACDRAADYLVGCQNSDGGWGGGPSVSYGDGGGSTIEESALAVEGLLHYSRFRSENDRVLGSGDNGQTIRLQAAIISGVEFLVRAIEQQNFRVPWPIGFYFAKLWYHERLYPIIFTTSALGQFLASPMAHLTDDAATTNAELIPKSLHD